MTAAGGRARISRNELLARAAVSMAAFHPELVTRKPGGVEWNMLAAWCAELWPNDEYSEIVAEVWRKDHLPGAKGWE